MLVFAPDFEVSQYQGILTQGLVLDSKEGSFAVPAARL